LSTALLFPGLIVDHTPTSILSSLHGHPCGV